MTANLQALARQAVDFETLATAFLDFLQESPRPSSVREWAAVHDVPLSTLRAWQKDRFIAWLRVPKDSRTPRTQGALAEWLGVSENTTSAWSQLPEVIQAVGRCAIASVQELVPVAVERIEDALRNPLDSLEAAKFVVTTATKGAMPAPAATVAVQVNNRIDSAIAAVRFSCGHTIQDHGPYDACANRGLEDLAKVPCVQPEPSPHPFDDED